MDKSLNSIHTLVESPFIIATIGGVTFGSYSGNITDNGVGRNIEYPNFMKSLSVTKVNGTVNTYTLNFEYQVRPNENPNLLDEVFSRASNDRQIILQYGDWNAPTQIYKEEKCIITNITTSLNMNNASIDYTINCTSDAIGLNSTTFNFPARNAKPSDILLEMLQTTKYGLKQVFSGMQNMNKVMSYGLLTRNDKKVNLLAQTGVTPLAYMGYLVDSMINSANKVLNGTTSSKYFLSLHDDYSNVFGGTYFKVTEVNKNTRNINGTDSFEIDINYPQDNFVTQFSLNNDQSWSILYNFNQEVSQEQYTYSVDDEGNITTTHSPSLLKSSRNGQISAAKSSWWTKMTEFPIEATLVIKGLVKPAILMTYVRLNVLFNGGVKHSSSGLYIITKQVDEVNSNGYKTTLTLLRVGGDI